MLTTEQAALWGLWKRSTAPQRNHWIADKVFGLADGATDFYADPSLPAILKAHHEGAEYHVRKLPRSTLSVCVLLSDGKTYTSPAMPVGEAMILSTLFLKENADDGDDEEQEDADS